MPLTFTPHPFHPADMPPVTLITDETDDVELARAAHRSANPARGRIAVDPTPATLTSAFLARDILAALGRTAYAPTRAPVITAAPAWRAVACWFIVDGIRELTVLRAHLLTPERAEQLSVLRELTGIRLILLAAPSSATQAARLGTCLAETGLTDGLLRLTADDARAFFTRSLPTTTPLCPTFPLSAAPVSSQPGAARSQYRAGQLAACTWLARHRRATGQVPAQRDLELFLSRLTCLSPDPATTLARIRGAQGGFTAEGLRLSVPHALATAQGPGLSTLPFTARTAHHISRAVPGPPQLAALASLLFTGAHLDRLVQARVDDIDPDGRFLALPQPESAEFDHHNPPPPAWYAVPPSARPFLRAARMFRQLEQVPGHFHLFSKSFGYRLEALVKDAGHLIPALSHLHPGPAWHHQARLTHR
ncbi:hypothetical protein [Streptomyces blastmyceticus]|uniref:Uncharacterized protein n=1 Tax=Streptomyces blastmyceticus TaxID=68180 RepID=A0ABN0XWJ5_9ACTN